MSIYYMLFVLIHSGGTYFMRESACISGWVSVGLGVDSWITKHKGRPGPLCLSVFTGRHIVNTQITVEIRSQNHSACQQHQLHKLQDDTAYVLGGRKLGFGSDLVAFVGSCEAAWLPSPSVALYRACIGNEHGVAARAATKHGQVIGSNMP